MTYVCIGEGDGPVESWSEGFEKPMDFIGLKMNEAETFDIEISWPIVLHGLNEYSKLDHVHQDHELLECLNGVDIRSELYGDETPGRGGYYTEVYVEQDNLQEHLKLLEAVAERLKKWWEESGAAADAEQGYLEVERQKEQKKADEAKRVKARKPRPSQSTKKKPSSGMARYHEGKRKLYEERAKKARLNRDSLKKDKKED